MKRLFWLAITCFAVDMANKNLYLLFGDEETIKRVYWTGQSLTFLCIYFYVYLQARKINQLTRSGYAFATMIAAMNWIAFAVGDLIDELTQTYQKSSIIEYGFFLLTIPYTIYLWKRRRLRLS